MKGNFFLSSYVSLKINKVRWQPSPKDSLRIPDTFIAGSWDDEQNQLFYFKVDGLQGIDADSDLSIQEPRVEYTLPFESDVTDIQYLSSNLVAVGSSLGSVFLYDHLPGGLKERVSWRSLHQSMGDPCSSTCLAVLSDEIVSVGEDGKIFIINVRRKHVQTIDNAYSCSITSCIYSNYNEVLTGNCRGQIQLWDLRSTKSHPSRVAVQAGEEDGVTCLASHPTQSHIVAAGSVEGLLSIWDLRQENKPVTLLRAHESIMTEVKFHPTQPNHLFTCSNDGGLWHWNAGYNNFKTSLFQSGKISDSLSETSPWLRTAENKDNIDIVNLTSSGHKPINSVDINHRYLVSGSDGETIILLGIAL